MSAINEILAWWAARMAELLPARLREAGLDGPALIADAQPDQPGILLLQRRGSRETPLAAPPRRARRVLLRFPAAAVLERRLVLPLAAEAELARVVAYEVDRISPFTLAEVAVAHRVEQRDRAAAKLHLRVALLPRAAIAPAAATVRGRGLDPAAVVVPRAGGGLWRFALHGPGAASPRRWPLAAAAAACLLLAAATIATPFLQQQHALDRLDARIARLRPDVEQATQLRRRIADSSSGIDAIAAETARVGQATDMLAALTSLLPDDTYLTALSIRQRVLTLTGRSASATRLIPLLAADPAIRNAAFAAPVTRVEGPRADVFAIRAEFGS